MPEKHSKVTVILDTNVWLSGIFWQGNAGGIIKLGEGGRIRIFVSREILQEIAKTLEMGREKFQRFVEDYNSAIEGLVEYVLKITEVIKPTVKLNIVTEDPSDNKILECAVAAKADYIISGDRHLLNLKSFEGIGIITPKIFLDKVITENKNRGDNLSY